MSNDEEVDVPRPRGPRLPSPYKINEDSLLSNFCHRTSSLGKVDTEKGQIPRGRKGTRAAKGVLFRIRGNVKALDDSSEGFEEGEDRGSRSKNQINAGRSSIEVKKSTKDGGRLRFEATDGTKPNRSKNNDEGQATGIEAVLANAMARRTEQPKLEKFKDLKT